MQDQTKKLITKIKASMFTHAPLSHLLSFTYSTNQSINNTKELKKWNGPAQGFLCKCTLCEIHSEKKDKRDQSDKNRVEILCLYQNLMELPDGHKEMFDFYNRLHELCLVEHIHVQLLGAGIVIKLMTDPIAFDEHMRKQIVNQDIQHTQITRKKESGTDTNTKAANDNDKKNKPNTSGLTEREEKVLVKFWNRLSLEEKLRRERK